MEHIYIVGSNDAPYKIGRSGNVRSRLLELQTAHPFPLRIVATAESASPIAHEREIHAALSKHRMSGEWFNCELPAILMEMNGLGLVPHLHHQLDSGEFWMDGEAFAQWTAEMMKPPFFAADAECARLLGISANGLLKMKKQGTDRRTALACRALLHRMEPYA